MKSVRNTHPYWIIRNTSNGVTVRICNLSEFCRKMKFSDSVINEMRYRIFRENKFNYKNYEITGAEYGAINDIILALHKQVPGAAVAKVIPLKPNKKVNRNPTFAHLEGRACLR